MGVFGEEMDIREVKRWAALKPKLVEANSLASLSPLSKIDENNIFVH